MAGPDPVRSAKSAGLRYVCDDQRGIRRERGPLGFRYIGSYIHPAILDAYESGLMTGAKRPAAKGTRNGGLRQDEIMTLALLRRCEKQGSTAKAA